MASISAALASSRSPFTLSARSPLSVPSRFKRAAAAVPFKCCSRPSPEVDSEATGKTSSLLGISTSSWCSGLGALGFLETGYLTYLKLTDSEAFCLVGGGSCSGVLNSDYSSVFGVPLSLIGMVAYGLVALLSLQQTRKSLLSVVSETDIQLILLGTTTSMATASAYFLYLLSTKLSGSSCSYCLMSAILSFSLFFITLKDFGFDNIQKAVGLQLAVAGVVITALSNSYMAVPQFSRYGASLAAQELLLAGSRCTQNGEEGGVLATGACWAHARRTVAGGGGRAHCEGGGGCQAAEFLGFLLFFFSFGLPLNWERK